MKILHISYEIYPVVGGTSTLLQYLMEGLEGSDCEIHLVTKTIDPNHNHVIKHGSSKIYTIFCADAEQMNPAVEFKTQMSFMRCIRKIVEDGVRFDLIHIHDALPIDLVPNLKKAFNIPVVMSYHITHHILKEQAALTQDPDIAKNTVALRLEEKGAQLADFYIAASKATKQWLVEYYKIPETKISLIPYGINLDEYPEEIEYLQLKRELGGEDKKIILYAGRFTLQKGLDYLIEAFKKTILRIPNIKLVLIGEGRKENEIREKLSQLGEDCYEIIPKIPFTKLPPYYRCADVVVMPSIFEPFGMVSIEGMASQAMMIISNIDGLSEIVKDQFNGLALQVEENSSGQRQIDAELLSQLIVEALTDEEMNMRLRVNARKFVMNRYSKELFAENMYRYYRNIIKQ
ncbi:glycosyltransferase family 4 protein [Paenibacillus sp. FSL K6-1096]|uniref:glycosyltransferase family 4 protein n=1 Tax=Paenibacillus sp. FSL K6-1096 TaxID=2921460 RepID=UPI0030EC6DDE